MAKWGELPLDIGIIIVEKLWFYEDVFSFSRVCNCWRRAATLANYRRSSVQTPWLMLTEPRQPRTLERRFYSIHDKRVRQLSLPDPIASDTRNTFVTYEPGGSTNHIDEDYLSRLYPPKEYNKESKWMYFSSCGWLICVTQIGLNVILIHPFSGKVIRTPTIPVTILQEKVKLKWHDRQYLQVFHRFALSESPLTAHNYTLAMIMSDTMAVWRSIDDHWTVFVDEGYPCLYRDVYFYKEELYAVRHAGRGQLMQVVACGIPSTACGSWTPTIKVVAEFTHMYDKYYLVGADDILFVVSRKLTHRRCISEGHRKYETESFDVWEVNFKDSQLIQVYCLGHRSFFVGLNSGFFVNSDPDVSYQCTYSTTPKKKLRFKRPKEYGLTVTWEDLDLIEYYCKVNCIYYTDDLLEWPYCQNEGGERDMGIYCLSTCIEEKEEYYKGTLPLNIETSPIWVEVRP